MGCEMKNTICAVNLLHVNKEFIYVALASQKNENFKFNVKNSIGNKLILKLNAMHLMYV